MTELPGFEDNLKESLQADAENALYAEQDNLAFQFLQAVNQNFEEYASRQGYDLDSIIQSGQVTDTSSSGNSVSATIEWTSGLTGLFEYGTSEHEINGDPVLSFVWSDPPGWVKEEFNQARSGGGQYQSGWRVFFSSVTHPGMPEARAIRGALNTIRLRESGSVTL